MISSRTFKLLGVANLILGALFTLSTLFMLVGLVAGPHTVELVAWFLAAFLAAIAFSLVQAGWNHLRAPNCKTALAVAANTSVVIFAIVASAARALDPGRAAEPGIGLGAILVAYAIYRRLLRPLALRTFAPDAKAA